VTDNNLDEFIKAVLHLAPPRAIHELLVANLPAANALADTDLEAAFARVKAELDRWELWLCFSQMRADKVVQHGAKALREMAQTRAGFMPWARDNVIENLRQHREAFEKLGAKRLRLFGSVARDEWRGTSSDIDLLVDTEEDHLGVAEEIALYCSNEFGYGWDVRPRAFASAVFMDHIEMDAVDILEDVP
jgi:predicted nucleotidyltransferase